MTPLTWRQQAMAAFLSAQDGVRRVTGTEQPLTALHAALNVAEEAIRADERDAIIALADSVKAVSTADEGTQCWFADLLRERFR